MTETVFSLCLTYFHHECICLTVALCDCVHGKGQHQLSQGEVTFQKVLFSQPLKQAWLVTQRWLSGSKLCYRALRLG